jgi:hypothetical protein
MRAVQAKVEKDARISERQAKTTQFQDDFMVVDLPAITEVDPLVGLQNHRASSPHQLCKIIGESSALLGLGPEEPSDADHVKSGLQSSLRLSMAARMALSMDPCMDTGSVDDGDPEETSFMIKIMNQLHLAEDGRLCH